MLQTGSKLSREDVRAYVRESIDIFVQLERIKGKRQVTELLIREECV